MFAVLLTPLPLLKPALILNDHRELQDTDEYLHSQNFGNVAEYIASVPQEISQLVVSPVRFGVSNKEIGRFKNTLLVDNVTGHFQYVGDNGSDAQLITQQQVHRGAANALGEAEGDIRV